MLRILSLILAVILLGSCAKVDAAPTEPSDLFGPKPLSSIEAVEPAATLNSFVFSPAKTLSVEETIEAYFDEQYKAYINLAYADISSILDMEQQSNRNMISWTKMLAQRRRLIDEYDFCYVEKTMFEYSINYEEQPDDERLEFWGNRNISSPDDVVVHFRITGEEGGAYPPIMALNSMHSIFLKKVGTQWKITRHYFPGSVRKFGRSGGLTPVSDDEMLEQLKAEFAAVNQPQEPVVPAGARIYNALQAVDYAIEFAEKYNPAFYNVGDWRGNCNNFVSQCVWFGFGDGKTKTPNGLPFMTEQWFGGSGGGTSAWENVDYFWSNITESRDMSGIIIEGISGARQGDIIQTRPMSGAANDDGYNHTLILTDQNTLKFAQNSPACLVYYSDLVNVKSRYIRPVYIFA